MVASFEFSLQTNLSKRTDQLKTRRVQQSDQVEPSAAAGGTARPFSSHQNLWYRSDGYFANAVAAQRREQLEQIRREWGFAPSAEADPRDPDPRGESAGTRHEGTRHEGTRHEGSRHEGASPRGGLARGGQRTPRSPRAQSARVSRVRSTTPRGRKTSDSVVASLDPNNTDLSSMPWANPRASDAPADGADRPPRLFSATGQRPLEMAQCLTNAMYSPRWTPRHGSDGWAHELLPPGARPRRYADSLVSLTSRSISDAERSHWSPRRVPSRQGECRPPAFDPVFGVAAREAPKGCGEAGYTFETTSEFFNRSVHPARPPGRSARPASARH